MIDTPMRSELALTSELEHIRPLLLTPAAQERFGTRLWDTCFDWQLDDGLRRVELLASAAYDAGNRQLVERFNARGFLPVLVASDDEPVPHDWPPCPSREALARPIGEWCGPSTRLIAHEPEAGPMCLIHVVSRRDAFLLPLSPLCLPEAPALEALLRMHAGCRPDFFGLNASQQDWMAYGEGLARWMARPRVGTLRKHFGLPDFCRWDRGALPAADFGLLDGAPPPQEACYLPLRGLPFAGLKKVEGHWQPHGPLPVTPDGRWLFAPELQSRLQALTSRGATVYSFPEPLRLAAAAQRPPAAATPKVPGPVRRLHTWHLDGGEVWLRVCSDADPGYCIEAEPAALAAQVQALQMGGQRFEVVRQGGVDRVPMLNEDALLDAGDPQTWTLEPGA